MIPALGSEQKIIWARLASIDAGAERGLFFRPDEGDEVVVGFLNDDPRQAIILGAMHSSLNKTPVPINEKNTQKGIFTKSNYKLLFDEEEETVTLATSNENLVKIDEKQGIISLLDKNGNKVELSKEGVVVVSAKNCEIIAEENLTLTAGNNVSIEGKKVDLI